VVWIWLCVTWLAVLLGFFVCVGGHFCAFSDFAYFVGCRGFL